MSTDTRSRKRKSIDGADAAVKKVKTATPVAKPAPLKSALKKPKDEVELKVAAKKDKKVNPKKNATKPKEPSPAAEEVKLAVEDADEAGAELTEDQTAALLAGFSSSEDEAEDEEEDGIALDKLPKPPKASALSKSKSDNDASGDPENTPGVIYIGRIPHGFFEHQMRAYFVQFGEITHLRLARNRKTGKSKHFGFIEFAAASVAEIVAKTMDKYLLFNHILQVRRVPSEQVPEGIWKGEGRKKVAPRNRLEGGRLKRGTDREGWEKRITREQQRRAGKADALKEMGYEFEAPAVKSVDEVPVQAQIEQSAGAEDKVDEVNKVDEAEKPALVEDKKEVEKVEPTVQAKKGKKSKAASTAPVTAKEPAVAKETAATKEPVVAKETKEETKKRPAAKAEKPKAKKAKK